MRTLNPKMVTTKRKQPASSNITSFFSPAPKRRAPEEHSVSADNSMQLPRDSMGQETRPPRPETEVATKPAQIASSFLLQIALESISVGLNFNIFLGEHAPRPPSSHTQHASFYCNSVPPLSFISGSAPGTR